MYDCLPVSVCGLLAYVLVPAEVRRGWKTPETRISMTVSHLVGAGIGTRVLCKSNDFF